MARNQKLYGPSMERPRESEIKYKTTSFICTDFQFSEFTTNELIIRKTDVSENSAIITPYFNGICFFNYD